MPQLLLELFQEEIPARMQAQAAADLLRLLTKSLAERGLTADDLAIPVEVLSRAEIGKLMEEQDVLMSF